MLGRKRVNKRSAFQVLHEKRAENYEKIKGEIVLLSLSPVSDLVGLVILGVAWVTGAWVVGVGVFGA